MIVDLVIANHFPMAPTCSIPMAQMRYPCCIFPDPAGQVPIMVAEKHLFLWSGVTGAEPTVHFYRGTWSFDYQTNHSYNARPVTERITLPEL